MARQVAKEMPVISETGNRGFTLLELLVTLAILVLMAAAWPFAAPRLFPRQQLRSEAQQLMSVLRAARMAARLTGTVQVVEIIDTGQAYRRGSDTHQMPAGLSAHLLTGRSALTDEVIFYPDGTSSGGSVGLTLGKRLVAVDIGQVTGHAVVTE